MSAYDFEVSNDGTVSLEVYKSTITNIVIPSKINNINVTSIGGYFLWL